MTISLRRILLGLVLTILVIAGAVTFARWPTHTRGVAQTQTVQTDPASLERGRYLATAADCIACHTAPDGRAFAGGLAIASPIGSIFSTNITPDKDTGIGNFSLDDFSRAVRYGIDDEGETLYPAMPYPSYAHISDEDITLIYGYFMHAVEPVRNVTPANRIRWPLSMRWPLAIWRKIFAPISEPPQYALRFADPGVARGAYLVQGAGHCGTCHTPRALTLQEKALDESSEQYLAGGQVIGGWSAVNLRGNSADGLGSWSAGDIVATLRTGRNETNAVIGDAMNDVVVHSTQHLTDEDLRAIASYLKVLTPARNDKAAFAADPRTAAVMSSGGRVDRGAEIYEDNCAACHRTNGEGSSGAFPKIAGNSSVLSADPSSLIRLILSGSSLPATINAPSALGMPGFGWRLSNAEVAQLLTFIRSGWGNHASSVDTKSVAEVRRAIESEPGAEHAARFTAIK
jgi:mono/diheme cytochrome c family protein